MSNTRNYFITSKEIDTPEQEFYTESPGFNDFRREYEKKIKIDGKDFNISINSFNINKKDLIKGKETDAYELIVNLKVSGIFSNYIYSSKPFTFVEIKNHFIYGFKLDDKPGLFSDYKPPRSIAFSKIEQLNLYLEFLNKVHSEPGDILSNDFCEETIESIIKDKKFYFDFALELLEYCKNTKNMIKILESFETKNCEIPTNFNASKYEATLEQIESNPKMYTEFCFGDGEDIKIKKKFYTLLAYFRLAHSEEKEKLKNLINKEDLLSLFAEIIVQNEKLYLLVEFAEDDLIKEIMKQKKVPFDCIKKIIATSNSVEKLLSFLRNYFDIIYKKCCKECLSRIERSNTYTEAHLENETKIFRKMFDILEKKEKESTIQEKLIKLFKKEEDAHHISHKKYQIILFNEKYGDLYLKYKEAELFRINDSIYICLRNDKKFEDFKKKEITKIASEQNGQYLQNLSQDISEYEKTDYGIYIYSENEDNDKNRKNSNESNVKSFMPLKLLDGIDLETFSDKNLKKWNKLRTKVFELKDSKYDLETYNIIQNIKNLDEFDTFLKIMYDDKDYNYEYSYEKEFILYLKDKFLSLIYKSKNHEYFSRIASTLIYKCDQLDLGPEYLISDIEKPIYKYDKLLLKSKEKQINENDINKIYEYLTNNYYISSKNLINHMADYIIDKNKISMVKNLTNIKEKIIPVIFAKIDNCITDKMLYDNWSNNTYFKLLNDMNTEGYAQYAENNIPNISKILNNLLLGMVSYKLINRIYSSNQKGFVTKISILIFSNESKKKTLFETIRNYLNNINKNLKNLAELKETIEKHYSWKYEFYRNISLIDKTVNSIQKGLLNEFKKAPTKDDLDKLNNIYRENDFHRKYIMKDSLVFKHENIVQGNYRSEIDKVFKNVSEKFNELGVLFEKKWQNNIKDETICEYFDIIKQTEEDEKKKATIVDEKLQKDLQILANYHCKYKDYSEINKIRDEIMYYINFIKIKSILNEMKSYCDSKKTPTNNEYKIKLQNAEMVLRPDTCSDIDNLMDSLVFEKMKGYQISNNPLKTIT